VRAKGQAAYHPNFPLFRHCQISRSRREDSLDDEARRAGSAIISRKLQRALHENIPSIVCQAVDLVRDVFAVLDALPRLAVQIGNFYTSKWETDQYLVVSSNSKTARGS
jgi:hypothetical protein